MTRDHLHAKTKEVMTLTHSLLIFQISIVCVSVIWLKCKVILTLQWLGNMHNKHNKHHKSYNCILFNFVAACYRTLTVHAIMH